MTGTDTDVGKTRYGEALLRAWRRFGLEPIGLKPIATGSQSDAFRLREAAGTELPLLEINPFFFRCPAAPALAASMEGRALVLPDVEGCVRPLLARFSCAIVEGVGGWKTPLTSAETVSDLAVRLGIPVVIVALCRLGVLNHTLLTVESIRAAGLRPLGIVLNGFSAPSVKTIEETAAALRRYSALPVAGFSDASAFLAHPPSWLLPSSGASGE